MTNCGLTLVSVDILFHEIFQACFNFVGSPGVIICYSVESSSLFHLRSYPATIGHYDLFVDVMIYQMF